MNKKSDRGSGKKALQNRSNLDVPPAARGIERRIVRLLSSLIKIQYASCLDKRFIARYREILTLFSRYQKTVLENHPLKTRCGKNCGICCNHWPEDTYSFEVRYIAEYLKKRRPRDMERIIETLHGDIECLDRIKKTVAARISDPKARAALGDIDPYDVVLSSFYQINRPCPLLDRNGSCSIYAIRPFTCRVYMSFSPPELCRPGKILGDNAMTYLLDLEKDTSELFDRLHFMYDVFDGETGLRAMLYKALTR
jgi:Fe-S-cluster containining protein